MKKIIIILFYTIIVNGVFGEVTKNVLFIYEENNININPWKVVFENELSAKNYSFDVMEAPKIGSRDLSQYDYIIIHGAVMAFTLKEPVRTWLKTKPNLLGKKVLLFVTANRWFLDRYYKQLLSLLDKRDAVVVDAISMATKILSDNEKRELVHNQLMNLK